MQGKNSNQNNNQVAEIVAVLRRDEVISVATETVYALAGSACSSTVVRKICALKGRDIAKPMAILLPSIDLIENYASEVPAKVLPLIKSCMPGPLTLLLPVKASKLSPLLTCHPLLGVRVPDSELLLAVLRDIDFPLVASSANLSGKKAASSAEGVRAYFPELNLPYLWDSGKSALQKPSTVLSFSDNICFVHRQGPITVAELRSKLPAEMDIKIL